MPGVGEGADRHVGQARGLVAFGQRDQQRQAAVNRVGLAGGDVDRQAGPDRGDLGRIGAPPRADEHGPGRISIDPEAATRIGDVGIDDGLVTGQPVIVGAGGLERPVTGHGFVSYSNGDKENKGPGSP